MSVTPAFRARLQATLACAGTTLLWWRHGNVTTSVLLFFATGFALLAWISPPRYAPVQRAFDFLTHGLLTAFSWLLLGLVYFGVFTPLRGGRALLRRQPFPVRADPAAATYLQTLPTTPRRFDRQF
jgi:hypothetical protein